MTADESAEDEGVPQVRGGRRIAVLSAFALALTELRRRPVRTGLATIGIALAVLSVTLLASVGFGVVDTADQQFDDADRDLWVAAGPVEFDPFGQGTFQNPLTDAHAVADNISDHDDVATAGAIAVEAVYAGSNESDLGLVTGVGIGATPGAVSISEGTGLEGTEPHYAEGSYDGPMTREALVGPQAAERLNVSVGDTVQVGGSTDVAREQSFTVVGISPDFERLVGGPAVVVPLSELQTVVGTAGSDRATFVGVTVESDADVDAVQAELAAEYPAYEVRTNREQLQAMVREQAVVISAGVALVVLALVVGVVQTANLLVLMVYQQRRTLAALRAIGLSGRFLVLSVSVRGLLLGLTGGLLGVALTPVAGAALNHLTAAVVGFEGLVQTPLVVYLAGAGIALGIGTIAGTAASWRLLRIAPALELQR